VPRSRLIVLFAVAATSGCRDLLGVEDPVVRDAGTPIDAPANDAPRVCTTPANLGDLALGSMMMPYATNCFYTPTDGPNAGKKTFAFAGTLPGGTMTVADVILVEIVRPASGFVTNVPINFTPTPDPSAPYTARAYLLGEFDPNAMTYQQLLVASNGAAVFTSIGEVSGSAINGSTGAITFKEVDETAGKYVTSGCTTELAGLAWFLTQTM
jgi:hypothetical protein